MTATLLIEIGVEELPPRAMRALAEHFARALSAALTEQGFPLGEAQAFATPRRITACINAVADQTAPQDVFKAGPTVAIAFDDNGAPTRAAEGFARSVGASIDALAAEDSDKGRRLVYRTTEAGRSLDELIQPAVEQALRGLPIPKVMRWGESTQAFVRPVHWLMALHGDRVLPLKLFGRTADREVVGHRFHYPETIRVSRADDYLTQMEDTGWVVADIDTRRARVEAEVYSAARRFGGRALVDDDLVEEVTALVEWPVGIAGGFDEIYLQLPREVLISTLQEHQRYFPIEATDEDGRLLPGFVTVANIQSRDVAQVIAGNERVVRPRLADALFFWEQDRRRGLASRVDDLDRVSFQQSLGSLADKSDRIARIAGDLAATFGADGEQTAHAARLAKADLLTEMVGEFPDLQGVMGYYYAREDGESLDVARALAEQYAPDRAGAPIAASAIGRALATADRLDTLSGIFAIDRRPTGDKDPFGLRRAALGVLRTVIEADVSVDLRQAITNAVNQQPVTAKGDTAQALWLFHMERLRHYYLDQNIAGDRFEAIANLGLTDVAAFDRRIRAVDAFARDPQARVVCDAHKRIRNILRRNADAVPDSSTTDRRRLAEPAERELVDAMQAQRSTVVDAIKADDPGTALSSLAMLAMPLDRFFDQIMVMADDPGLRSARLGLLRELDELCRQVADISELTLD